MNRKTIRLRHTASFALAGLLTLSACGGGTASTPSTPSNPTPAPQKVTISGTVHLPAGTLSLAGTEADWSAPHVPGELLVASDPDTLSAQGLGSEEGIGSLLAGLTTEPLGELGLLRVQTPDPQAWPTPWPSVAWPHSPTTSMRSKLHLLPTTPAIRAMLAFG
ncbi:hypothetical protein [Deinococcus radiophilus]|uniref:hypothetical protein n=1 Tax=Deinococcus radiophilus TaxID=32062 RepID=UPI0036216FDB